MPGKPYPSLVREVVERTARPFVEWVWECGFDVRCKEGDAGGVSDLGLEAEVEMEVKGRM